jgi:hypothetical protein
MAKKKEKGLLPLGTRVTLVDPTNNGLVYFEDEDTAVKVLTGVTGKIIQVRPNYGNGEVYQIELDTPLELVDGGLRQSPMIRTWYASETAVALRA